MIETQLLIEPMGKPRMTKADRWKKRPCVLRYWEWCDRFRALLKEHELTMNPGVLNATFIVKMPNSWSKKKKAYYLDQPHEQRPDVDNMVKAVLDASFKKDEGVHTLRVNKIWGTEAKIIIRL